ncbi:MAG TPA: sigma-70 family RNA polymerase sigma factor [Chloroflexota bacterium]|nr:sigma-70 family RNA polymerase sigma factor [Chloroflexota bacterium]HUM69998.1 sigma-70 family RNA polymerase sigma factor [Chloroflexota bacterium]
MSDWDLIQACQRGDEQAWGHVITRYKRLIFSIALTYGLGHEDAAEIVQLTFIMFLEGLDNLHADSHLGGWLGTVARRNTWHLLNRRRRENLENEAIDQVVLVDETSGHQQEKWELLNWLDDGLAQLDRTCRELLLALYFDPQQPAYSEVADRMGLAVGSIGPMRARCLLRLRHILGER